jgi:hypothetical protein
MEKILEDYVARMGLFPSIVRPRPIERDEEFVYFEFVVPKIYLKEVMRNKLPLPVDTMDGGTLEPIIALKLDYYPVYIGIKEINRDEECVFYKVPVPRALLASKYGVIYRGPREM